MSSKHEPTLIKKYANRRLYNTAISQYITLDDVAEMVQNGEEFKVIDAKTGKDLTRSVLAQIIVDEEASGESLLPINFLRQLIRMYSDNMKPFVPHYLEHMMQAFVDNQETWAENMPGVASMKSMMENGPGASFQQVNQAVEDMTKQNIKIFDSAMKMFNPFYESKTKSDDNDETPEDELKSLEAELKKIQDRIKSLKSKK